MTRRRETPATDSASRPRSSVPMRSRVALIAILLVSCVAATCQGKRQSTAPEPAEVGIGMDMVVR